MANVSTSGLSELIRSLEKVDLFNEETEKEILTTGGDILIENIGEEMVKSRFNIDHLVKKLYYSKIKKNRFGEYHISVSVKGKNEQGTRNALIVFVLNYGRSERYGKIDGGYFWTKGTRESEEPIAKAVEKIVNRKLKEGGLL